MARRRAAQPSTSLPLDIEPRTLFVTGKGGVGKTTVAASLALAYRDAGVRTLLVELAGQASPARLIAGRDVTYDPHALAPCLWALRIDQDSALREYARLRLKVKLVADRLVGNPVIDQFAQAAPGFRELLVLGKLWSLSNERNSRNQPRYEAIIVDAPATGHGVGLLGMAGAVARMFPVGPIATEARNVDGFVRDPNRTATVLVTLPEEMPVNETIDLHGRLDDQGVAVAGTIVNGLLPARFGDGEASTIAATRERGGLERHVDAALATALYEHDRRQAQEAEVARLREAIGGAPATLPYMYARELGREHVRELARWLTPAGQALLDDSQAGERAPEAPPGPSDDGLPDGRAAGGRAAATGARSGGAA